MSANKNIDTVLRINAERNALCYGDSFAKEAAQLMKQPVSTERQVFERELNATLNAPPQASASVKELVDEIEHLLSYKISGVNMILDDEFLEPLRQALVRHHRLEQSFPRKNGDSQTTIGCTSDEAKTGRFAGVLAEHSYRADRPFSDSVPSAPAKSNEGGADMARLNALINEEWSFWVEREGCFTSLKEYVLNTAKKEYRGASGRAVIDAAMSAQGGADKGGAA